MPHSSCSVPGSVELAGFGRNWGLGFRLRVLGSGFRFRVQG